MKLAIIPFLFILLFGCTKDKDHQQSAPPPTNSTSTNSESDSQSYGSSNNSDWTSEQSEEDTSEGTTDNPSQPENSQQVNLIQETVELAKKGTVKNSIFPLESTTFDEITAKWGEPNQLDYVAGNRYATYSNRGFVFGVNKGEQIFDIRSYAKELQQLTFDNIKNELGAPDDIRNSNGDTIWVYNVSDRYQLKFVGSKATIDHISVIYPAGAKNNMAG